MVDGCWLMGERSHPQESFVKNPNNLFVLGVSSDRLIRSNLCIVCWISLLSYFQMKRYTLNLPGDVG
ncbi:hypothetical protein [Tolypothrix sp. NIES-4075]|uniref:hypothetical protein n=1 Tax=Tolypothrix sp. NIES-4075 TaxID=2005459 RepID=UPI001180AF92|nr:hypothetical protein [Tolypothrix sp. NIES-4075]